MSAAWPVVDHVLARRLESVVLTDMPGFIRAGVATGLYPEAATLEVAGGVAVWLEAGNPVNGVYAAGMRGPVTAADIERAIAFYAERGERASVNACPLAHESLVAHLAARGFVARGFEDVLYQPLPPVTVPPASDVFVAVASSPGDLTVWADVVARGFGEGDPTPMHQALARVSAARPETVHFLGLVDGQPAGAGMLVVHDRLAMLNADATLPERRGRGVQTALLAARVAYAAEVGCDLACIEAEPGGASHRNQQRAGFREAYTRVTLALP